MAVGPLGGAPAAQPPPPPPPPVQPAEASALGKQEASKAPSLAAGADGPSAPAKAPNGDAGAAAQGKGLTLNAVA